MTTYIIYHQVKPGVDCPDGIAAAWTANRAYSNAIVRGWTYQAEGTPIADEEIKECDRIVIVDFSFPSTQLEHWADLGAEVIVLDHHETAMNNLKGLSDRILAQFDMKECGATLAWQQLCDGEPMPAFLEYVRDRDLWDWLLPETQEIHEAMSNVKWKLKDALKATEDITRSVVFKWFDHLAQMSKDELLAYLMPIGEPLVAPKREKVEAIASRALGEVFCAPDKKEHSILCVRLADDGSEDRFVSDVCMKLYRDHPQASFTACVTSDGTWSLRSDKHGNNTDVGAIAASMGGGGHRNASGFKPADGSNFLK